MADAAVLKQLAPTGRLRVAMAVSPSPSAQYAISDGDTMWRDDHPRPGARQEARRRGGNHPAQRLGRDPEFGRRQQMARRLPAGRRRAQEVRRLRHAYHLLQSTFMVRPGSTIRTVTDADAKRRRHRRRRQHRHLPRRQGGDARRHPHRIRQGRPRRRGDERRPHRSDRAVAGIAARPAAQNPRRAHHRRCLHEYLHLGRRAEGPPGGAAYVSEFIEEAKASGLVRDALDEMGPTATQVAPAAMQS